MINFKSNFVISLCSFIAITSSLISQPSEAKNLEKKKAPRVEMKCYVELVGGVSTIYSAVLPNNEIAGLAEHLIGKKISMAGMKKKQRIYKVFECISYKENFTNSAAKLAEQNTVG
jgi:hypothetical protein